MRARAAGCACMAPWARSLCCIAWLWRAGIGQSLLSKNQHLERQLGELSVRVKGLAQDNHTLAEARAHRRGAPPPR